MTAKINHDILARRLALISEGLSAPEIAKREGCGYSTILNWAKRHKITIAKAKMGAPRRADWQSLMDAGMTAREAAKAAGLSFHSAYSFASKTGQRWAPAIVKGKPVCAAKETTVRTTLASLDPKLKDDVQILMTRGRYSLTRALAIATQPRVKFNAARLEAAQ